MQNPVQTDVSCAMFLITLTSRDVTFTFAMTDHQTSGLHPGSLQAKIWLSIRANARHGIGYTKISADYSDIHSEALYYVPLGKSYEVWALSVTNHSDHERNLTLSGYAEFTNHSNYEQDPGYLQYSLFISRTLFEGNRITQQFNGNLVQFLKMRM